MIEWFRRFFSDPVTGSPWSDVNNGGAEMSIRKPIHIRRSMFSQTRYLAAGDVMTVKMRGEGPLPEDNYCETTPEFPITESMAVDSCTKFEVRDEFGVDVGIGFVLGKAKRQ